MLENENKPERSGFYDFVTTVAIAAVVVTALFAGLNWIVYPFSNALNRRAAQERIDSNRVRPLAYNASDPNAKQLAESITAYRAQYDQQVDNNRWPITLATSEKDGILHVKHNSTSYLYFSVDMGQPAEPEERSVWIKEIAGPRMAADLFEKEEPRPMTTINNRPW